MNGELCLLNCCPASKWCNVDHSAYGSANRPFQCLSDTLCQAVVFVADELAAKAAHVRQQQQQQVKMVISTNIKQLVEQRCDWSVAEKLRGKMWQREFLVLPPPI